VTYQAIALILKRLEAFGKDVADAVKLKGVPRDLEFATALANKKDDPEKNSKMGRAHIHKKPGCYQRQKGR
jgi:hypothetical protein